MILSETINGMICENYKERFIDEYQQLIIRYNALKKMLDKWGKNELNFNPICPRDIYELQMKAMKDYAAVLEARAVMEYINLQTLENNTSVNVGGYVGDYIVSGLIEGLKEQRKIKPAKYRKKPVVVEAYQTDKEMIIHTLEGDMKANVGDYIITGLRGEQYPCKPDIFEKTYEKVSGD